ncbi:hypothetical protein ALNOE001_08410 [Candidatus Methanobinarius endosymbioticus]|uniref:Uncharacterized protein n=1 Tax=Candidatus Methanobinarius endosymbioticus TaxID=2006182 RepID=A0A366MCK3_9EURY|nr:hypothetical protein ALNOE001_08410 [Candidatus Methanobinarius endosymbioticus]
MGGLSYFESKEKLIEEVEKDMIAIKNSFGSFKDKIKLIADYNLRHDHHTEKMKTFDEWDISADYYILYLESFRRNKNSESVLKKFSKDLFETYKEIVDEAKKSGEIKNDIEHIMITLKYC